MRYITVNSNEVRIYDKAMVLPILAVIFFLLLSILPLLTLIKAFSVFTLLIGLTMLCFVLLFLRLIQVRETVFNKSSNKMILRKRGLFSTSIEEFQLDKIDNIVVYMKFFSPPPNETFSLKVRFSDATEATISLQTPFQTLFTGTKYEIEAKKLSSFLNVPLVSKTDP